MHFSELTHTKKIAVHPIDRNFDCLRFTKAKISPLLLTSSDRRIVCPSSLDTDTTTSFFFFAKSAYFEFGGSWVRIEMRGSGDHSILRTFFLGSPRFSLLSEGCPWRYYHSLFPFTVTQSPLGNIESSSSLDLRFSTSA